MKIGFTELIIIFIVALFVVGPDKLPYYARKFGEALAQFRKYSDEATKEIKESIVEPLEEAQRPLKEAMEPLKELDRELRSNVNDVQKSFANIGKDTPAKKDSGSASAGSAAGTGVNEPADKAPDISGTSGPDTAEQTGTSASDIQPADTATPSEDTDGAGDNTGGMNASPQSASESAAVEAVQDNDTPDAGHEESASSGPGEAAAS